MNRMQLNELLDILAEHKKEARDYRVREQTGNSEGKLKELYCGRAESHERAALLLMRFLRWNGYIEQDNPLD